MAEAKATFTTSDVWDDGKKIHAVGRLALTAGPDTYTTGGIAFNILANSVDGAGAGTALPAVSSQPIWGNIVGVTYFGQYLPATNKLKMTVIVGGAEVASGAIPAGLSSDTINAYFIFDKFA